MNNVALLILTYLLGVAGICYLCVSFGCRKSRQAAARRAAQQTAEAVAALAEASEPEAPPVPAPPDVDLRVAPIPGSDLHFCCPFGPTDDIFDAWIKFQAFRSSQPITVRLVPNDSTAPILRSAFAPDTNVQSDREEFSRQLSHALRDNAGRLAGRAVRSLSSYGVPIEASESAFRFYSGTLQMSLEEVNLAGLTFSITAAFQPDLGRIVRHLADPEPWLEYDMSCNTSPDAIDSSAAWSCVPVAFPFSFTRLTLLAVAGRPGETDPSKIIQAITAKYARYVTRDESGGLAASANSRVTVITDGIVLITLRDGYLPGYKDRCLRIEYRPFPGGPIDRIAAGDEEFARFAASLAALDRARPIDPYADPSPGDPAAWELAS